VDILREIDYTIRYEQEINAWICENRSPFDPHFSHANLAEASAAAWLHEDGRRRTQQIRDIEEAERRLENASPFWGGFDPRIVSANMKAHLSDVKIESKFKEWVEGSNPDYISKLLTWRLYEWYATGNKAPMFDKAIDLENKEIFSLAKVLHNAFHVFGIKGEYLDYRSQKQKP
jgi:hypothetical protein